MALKFQNLYVNNCIVVLKDKYIFWSSEWSNEEHWIWNYQYSGKRLNSSGGSVAEVSIREPRSPGEPEVVGSIHNRFIPTTV